MRKPSALLPTNQSQKSSRSTSKVLRGKAITGVTHNYLLMMLLCKYCRPVLSTARRLVGVGGTSQTMLSSQTEPGATPMELRTTFAETGSAFQAMLKDLEFGFLKYCTIIYSLIIITLFMTLIYHYLYSALNSSNASLLKRPAWKRTK